MGGPAKRQKVPAELSAFSRGPPNRPGSEGPIGAYGAQIGQTWPAAKKSATQIFRPLKTSVLVRPGAALEGGPGRADKLKNLLRKFSWSFRLKIRPIGPNFDLFYFF